MKSVNVDLFLDDAGRAVVIEYPVQPELSGVKKLPVIPAALAGYTVIPDFRLPAPPPSPITCLVSPVHALRLREIRELSIFASAEARLRRLGLSTTPDAIETEARKIAGVLEKYS